MSTSYNEDAAKAVSNQGEFHSRVAPSEPLSGPKHKPGTKASPHEHQAEFHAQTLPAGTAPPDRTFAPAITPEATGCTDHTGTHNRAAASSLRTSAADTLPGATSAAVHAGLGKPVVGQTSTEAHHDGQRHRKKQREGLAGVAAGAGSDVNAVDPHDPAFADQRGLDTDVDSKRVDGPKAGQRMNAGAEAAEERLPEAATSVAAEAPGGL